MAKPELGTKRLCAGCSAKFYDLSKTPIVCPKCGTVYEVAPPPRGRSDIPRDVPAEAAVEALLEPRLPRTFYFSSYSALRGRYTLEEVLAAVQAGSEDEQIQAAADFLRLARVDPDTMKDADFEKSNGELEATSSLLTNRVKKHWKQNKHLKLAVKIESKQTTDPSGYPAINNYLQFRVEDTRHDFSNRLDRRSTGFQWFVSFLASFLEFQKDKNRDC